MTTPSRIAIIGCGQSVDNHLHALHALGDRVRVVAAVDTHAERVRAVCAAHAIPQAYTDTAAMLAAEAPEVVCIITPPATHRDLTIACLEAGAWVFCEKPLCLSLAEFDEITQAEARTGGFVSTVFQWRFGSAAQHLRRLMVEQAFGRPLLAICQTLWYRTPDYYAVHWRNNWAKAVGGPTATLGIHLIDLLLWLWDDWQDVQAVMATLDRPIEVEDVALGLVRFRGGGMATLVNSALSPRQTTHLRLDFQRATLEVETLYHYDNSHWRCTAVDNDPAVVQAWSSLNTNTGNGHEAQLGALLDSRAAGQRPPVSGDEARRILEFLACFYKSAQTGQVVARGSITPDDQFYHAMNGVPPARATP